MSDTEMSATNTMETTSPAPQHKKWFLIFAAVLLLLALVGAVVWALLPKTVTIRLCTQSLSYDSDGTLVSRTDYTYDDAGALLSIQFYDADGTADGGRKCTYREGENGEITQREGLYQADGELITWIEFTYDRTGRLLRNCYNFSGGEDAEYCFENSYDAKGQLVSQQNYDAEGAPLNRTEWTYDDKGNQIREQYYTQSGAPGDWKEHLYDANGQDLGWQYYNADGSLGGRMEYTYDEQGNRIREQYYADEEGTGWYMTYTYDSEGRQTGKEGYVEDGSVISRSQYEYDEAGNRFLLQEDQDGDGKTDIWMESTYEDFPVSKDSLAAKLDALKKQAASAAA